MPRTARTGIARFVSAAWMLGTGSLLLAAASAVQASPDKQRAGSDAATVSRLMAQAKRGDAHAQAMLGFMYANGTGVPQSYNVAVDWYLKSAEQGDPEGQYLLGLMYDKGFGVNMDVVQAYKWLNLATAHAPRQNRENFLKMRDAIGSKMTPVQIDKAQKLAVEFVPGRR